jgi:hypothetical protein
MSERDIAERIDAAIERITSGNAAMRVPAEDDDPDLVLAEARMEITLLRGQLANARGTLRDLRGAVDFHNGHGTPTIGRAEAEVYCSRADALLSEPALDKMICIPLEMNEDLEKILGRLCFQCGPVAQVLRQAGHTIKTRAESEQAAVILWLLRLYADHGHKWHLRAGDMLDSITKKGGQ